MSGRCHRCGTPLEKPGDYCLTCRTPNADGVVVDAGRERATLTVLDGDAAVGETTITTTPQEGELAPVERRNFAGRIVDEVRRKRPEAVYLAGDHEILRAARADLRYDCYRVAGDDPVAAALARREARDLEVVEAPAAEKLGGSHGTLIGGRAGRTVIETVAGHPHVKKIVPGPIEAGGTAAGGVRAKATRADDNGNLRLLLRDGGSVQENRIVTTAMNRDLGERIRADLNELLEGAGHA